MRDSSLSRPTFHVTHDSTPGGTLLGGFSAFGLAGLTAVDFLADHLELEVRGHIAAPGLPTITPFEDGSPRHPIRLYSRDDLDVTVLVGETTVPAPAADSLSEAVLEWTAANDVDEVVMLSGVPVPHGPDAHRTFYVATDDFRERRLATDAVAVAPMRSGFLDGTNAALARGGLDSPLAVCILVTPVHAQAPDVEAAVRLVESVEAIYDLGIDADPLAAFASEVRQYYADLAARMEAQKPDGPEDRMYM